MTDANGSGYDSFGFSVNDGTEDSAASYTMTIDVAAVNDAPVAADDSYTVNEDETLTVDWWNTDWARRQQITLTISRSLRL